MLDIFHVKMHLYTARQTLSDLMFISITLQLIKYPLIIKVNVGYQVFNDEAGCNCIVFNYKQVVHQSWNFNLLCSQFLLHGRSLLIIFM